MDAMHRMNELAIAPEVLMERAVAARGHAYVPYSHFPVGAAILNDDGRIFDGCNVENASYGLSICAERVAMTKAVYDGATRPVAVAIAGRDGCYCPPCGACRQFLSEFGVDMIVILAAAGGLRTFRLKGLLPEAFSLEDDI